MLDVNDLSRAEEQAFPLVKAPPRDQSDASRKEKGQIVSFSSS
jgi:hypothetical protein